MVTVALFKTMFEDCGLKFLNSCLKASVIFLGAIFFCLCLFYIALVHGQGESDLPAGPAAGTLQVLTVFFSVLNCTVPLKLDRLTSLDLSHVRCTIFFGFIPLIICSKLLQ